MKKNRLYQAVFVVIMILMFVPMVQQLFHFASVEKLKGSIIKVENPTLSKSSWWNEEYQPAEEKYLNQNFGFRSSFVRLNNQLSYWFFKQTTAKGVIIGKENYLYETGYLKSYFGDYNVGEKAISERIKKMKAVSDTLQKLGKDLVVIAAPGKATFYPEYIPEKYFEERKTTSELTNYVLFSKLLKENSLKFIDFNSLFVKMKDTSRYSLYAKTGIHWSQYGAMFAADSILNYLEDLRVINLPDMVCDSFKVSNSLQFYDRDIEEGMNLIFDIPNITMAYPYISFDKKNSDKLDVLVISDSFYWPLYDVGLSEEVFNDAGFWYYNKQEFTKGKKREVRDVDSFVLADELAKKDVIILMATESNIGNMAWGFVEDSYSMFFDSDGHLEAEKNRQINSFIEKIKKDENWYNDVIKKAKENNISVDSMLWLDAKYMVETTGN